MTFCKPVFLSASIQQAAFHMCCSSKNNGWVTDIYVDYLSSEMIQFRDSASAFGQIDMSKFMYKMQSLTCFFQMLPLYHSYLHVSIMERLHKNQKFLICERIRIAIVLDAVKKKAAIHHACGSVDHCLNLLQQHDIILVIIRFSLLN